MSDRNPVFVGRAHELATAGGFVDAVANGAPGLLVVEAEAGAGKTSLLRQVVGAATAARSWTVLRAEGDPNDPRALQCLATALDCRRSHPDPTRARIAELLAGAPASSDDGITAAVHELVVDVLERCALEQPVLLVVDDLHWADDATLAVLGALARRLRGLAVGVLGASRPSPRVHAALERHGPSWLALGPLNDDALTAIAYDATGVEPSADQLASWASVRSNPFLVAMLATTSGGGVGAPGALDPAPAAQVLGRVMSGLTPPVRAFLELAAVAGRELDAALLADASGARVANVVMMAREAIERGLLDTDGEVVRFRHDLYAEALVAALPVAARDDAHLRLGRTLARRGDAPGRAAFHLDASAYLLGPDDVVDVLRVVESLPHDDLAALALTQRGHDLRPHDPRVLVARMRCLAARHQHDEVVRLARPVLVDADPVGSLDDARFTIRLLAAASLARTNGNEAAIAMLADGLAEHRLAVEQRADFLTTMARLQWYDRDVEHLRDSAGAALRISRDAGYLKGVVDALCVLSESAALVGDAAEALQDAEQAVELASRVRGRPWIAPQLALGNALVGSGRLREGLAVLSRNVLVAERTGDAIAVGLATMTMTSGRLNLGDWDEFVAEADAMVEIARETGVRTGIVFPLAMAAVAAVRRGEHAAALEHIARARMEGTVGDAHPSAALGGLVVDMAEHEARGRLEEATAHAAWAAEALAPVGLAVQAQFAMDGLRLAWTIDDRAVLERMVVVLRSASDASGTPTRRAMLAMGEAFATEDAARVARASQLMAGTERAWDAAVVHHVAGLLAARAGDPAASTWFADAAARYDALGSSRFAYAARAGLALRAVHDADLAARTSAVAGASRLDSLTGAERRVLELVATGAANGDIAAALYVSKRTVESHLAALYRKLEVSTRVGLVRVHETGVR